MGDTITQYNSGSTMTDPRLLTGDFSEGADFTWTADNDKEMEETKKTLIALAEADIWSAPSDGPNGCKISSSPPTDADPLAKVRSTVHVNCSPQEAIDFLTSIDVMREHKLDPSWQSGDNLAQLNQDNGSVRLRRSEWKPGWPVWNREIVWVTKVEPQADGSVCAISRSCISSCVPLRDQEVVRAVLVGDLVWCKPAENGSCDIVKVSSVDPSGWIP